jgi:hypothetical protein
MAYSCYWPADAEPTRKCVRPRPKHCADPFLQAPWRSLSRHFHRTVAETLGGWQTSLSHRSNYALREEVLAFRSDKRMGPTAVITHGANPGLASALVKQALLNMALQNRLHGRHPSCYEDWAALETRLGVKAIHIAAQDTRFAGRRKKRDEFVNTWSVDAFVEEGLHRRNPDGAATNSPGPTMQSDMASDATQRSTSPAPASQHTCAAGRRWADRITDISLRTANPFDHGSLLCARRVSRLSAHR